jgi:hypothetical protein
MRAEVWTWAYLAQQVVMLGMWVFLLSIAWGEVCACRMEIKTTGPRNHSCNRKKITIKRHFPVLYHSRLRYRHAMVKEKAE